MSHTVTKLAALNAGKSYNFLDNENPKCPHCGTEHNIEEHEDWQLYDADGMDQEIRCSSCDLDFTVVVNIKFSFSTDDQPDDDDESTD